MVLCQLCGLSSAAIVHRSGVNTDTSEPSRTNGWTDWKPHAFQPERSPAPRRGCRAALKFGGYRCGDRSSEGRPIHCDECRWPPVHLAFDQPAQADPTAAGETDADAAGVIRDLAKCSELARTLQAILDSAGDTLHPEEAITLLRNLIRGTAATFTIRGGATTLKG